MRSAAVLALILLLAACKDREAPDAKATGEATSAAAASAKPAPPTAAMAPADPAAEVSRLARRIEACEHFAGEEPYDAARAAELRKQVAANCPGNAEELKRLRRQHAADPALKRQLDALQVQQP